MDQEALLELLAKVRRDRGLDFRGYKSQTLSRRIQKCVTAAGAASFSDYARVLDERPNEYRELLRALTIKVTGFFRDPDAWSIVYERVMPILVSAKVRTFQTNRTQQLLRFWSAGCATGEEPYTLALLAHRFLAQTNTALKATILGTDLDREPLLKARRGEYAPSALREIPELFRNGSLAVGGLIRLRDSVRNLVHFRFHDLGSSDPPGRMDLIVCRNVAIYFDRPLQEKVFSNFHRSLSEGGFLFLGKAEAVIGSARDQFETVDRRWKIYRKL